MSFKTEAGFTGSAPPELITFDPHRDFTIIARDGHQVKRFLVNSSCLGLNSPVWRAMLQPGRWSESNARAIDLSDDNFLALQIVLDICHFRFDKTPAMISTKILYQLGIFCDKYDCMGVIRPWVTKWLRSWLSTYGYRSVSGEDLLICWHFGLLEAFRAVKYDLVVSCSATDGENWVFPDGTVANLDGIDNNTIVSMFEPRCKLLQEVHGVCRDTVISALTTTICKVWPGSARSFCDDVWFGFTYRSLSKFANIQDPDFSVKLVSRHSLEQIWNTINRLSGHSMPLDRQDYHRGHEDHNKCQAAAVSAMKETISERATSLNVDVLAFEMEHLKNQAAKCGTTLLSGEKLIRPKMLPCLA